MTCEDYVMIHKVWGSTSPLAPAASDSAPAPAPATASAPAPDPASERRLELWHVSGWFKLLGYFPAVQGHCYRQGTQYLNFKYTSL